ncbi:GNAT family N-acetyltransferase [Marispirochaeta sp.]|uniref:GNAT family N-acetyltransferase n=1 Tax=Marispirochaeta sp. TaxID=2038653 RepID=UPI0029C63457|nr:GNAT family N-acetyltransferase [Marispirochaeta sp.]
MNQQQITEIQIREAQEQDLAGVLRLYQHLLPEEDFSAIEQFRNTWKTLLQAGDIHKILVADTADDLAATCVLSILPNLTRGQRPYALIENVVTDPVYRRKGYGRALLQNAIERAHRRNCYKVMLLSSTDRIHAHEFYKSLGFDAESKTGFQLRLP